MSDQQTPNGLLKQLNTLLDAYDMPNTTRTSLLSCVKLAYESDRENHYSAPMLWIGLYIAFASLVCILPMVADLLHGLRSRRLWFPSTRGSKWFNAGCCGPSSQARKHGLYVHHDG
ncbi:hypothetical protein HanPI659440_Chr10g0396441 [Helianthus annuus]|nr:hypothetical protein HanPI659440_Chr10g0396441 [Helianthus annuus]